MKQILISGASSGIGYETVLQLAKKSEDIHIHALARREDKLQALQVEFSKVKLGNKYFTFTPIDLSDFSSNHLLNELKKSFVLEKGIKLDVMINNAGFLVNKPFLETTNDDWLRTIQVNLFSTVQLVRDLFPYFNSKEKSHIVNIGSMGGVQGTEKYSGISAYSVSKGAVNTLTESLAVEFRKHNIAVNCINPGAVQTDMLEMAFPGFEAPIKAQDFANYIADFALSAHRYMNGQLVDVSFRR